MAKSRRTSAKLSTSSRTVTQTVASAITLVCASWLFPILMAPYFSAFFVKDVLARAPFLASAISVLLPADFAAPFSAPAFALAGLLIRFGSRISTEGPEQPAYIIGTLAATIVWAPLMATILIPLRSAQVSSRGMKERIYELGVATGIIGLIQIFVKEYSHIFLAWYSILPSSIVRTPWHLFLLISSITSPFLLYCTTEGAKRVSTSITLLALIILSISHPKDTILSSVPSNTGLIVVAEYSTINHQEFRYMRCDHSLLGGLWLGPTRSELKMQFGKDHIPDESFVIQNSESVYTAFYVQEAITLLTGKDKRFPKSALAIGLGVGIVPTTLIREGHHVSLIEIDPEVYNAAVNFFGLQAEKIDNVWLEDARKVIPMNIESRQEWDWIIHDVFTGGAVPGSLFTMECWSDIKNVMKDDGIIAINFAGRIQDDAGASILKTVFSSFEQCRAYTDQTSPNENAEIDFINMTVFCAKTEAKNILDFQEPTANQIRSPMRKQLLTNLSENRIFIPQIMGWKQVGSKWEGKGEILEDVSVAGKMKSWQKEGIAEHWGIMRQVMEPNVWTGV